MFACNTVYKCLGRCRGGVKKQFRPKVNYRQLGYLVEK